MISPTVISSATMATTVANRHPQAADGRLAAHDIWVGRDPAEGRASMVLTGGEMPVKDAGTRTSELSQVSHGLSPDRLTRMTRVTGLPNVSHINEEFPAIRQDDAQ